MRLISNLLPSQVATQGFNWSTTHRTSLTWDGWPTCFPFTSKFWFQNVLCKIHKLILYNAHVGSWGCLASEQKCCFTHGWLFIKGNIYFPVHVESQISSIQFTCNTRHSTLFLINWPVFDAAGVGNSKYVWICLYQGPFHFFFKPNTVV